MFSHVIRYDWLALRASRQLVAGLGLLALFVLIALWNGQRHVAVARRTQAELQQADAQNYAALSAAVRRIEAGTPFAGNAWENPQDPYRAGSRLGGHYAVLPPAPLAPVAVGQSDLLPAYYQPVIGKQSVLYHQTEIASAEQLYDGSFDLAFVLVYLVPLLAIAWSYNLVAAEREQGTLALLLTSGAAPRQVLLDKIGFRWLLLNAAFAILVVGGLLGLGAPLGAAAGPLGWLLLLALAYSAFWFALAFWVNSRGYDSGTNAAALVGTWLVLVLLVPALLSAAAGALYPVPARSTLTTRTREAAAEAKQTGSQQLAKYFEDHPELAAARSATTAAADQQDFAQTALRTQLAVDAAVRPLEQQFRQQRQQQQALIARLRFLSPAVFVQQSLGAVAGTDAARYAGFETQVVAYRQQFQDYFAGKMLRHEPMRATDYAQVPTFRFQPSAPGMLAPGSLLNLAWLLALTAGLVVLGLAGARHLQLARS